MKLFVDNNIAPRLARAVATVVEPEGHTLQALRDRFPPNVKDIEWIAALDRDGARWWFLSDDHRIRKNPAEREALRRARIGGFFLAKGWRKLGTVEKTGRLLLRWPQLVNAEQLFTPGALIEVPVKGTKLTQLPL